MERKELIRSLKEQHGEVFEGIISYRNEKGEPETVRFYHRRPSFEDYEAFQGDVMRSSMPVANQNLIASITLHPPGADVVGELQSCPLALDRWLQKIVLPIFGGDVVEVSSKSL